MSVSLIQNLPSHSAQPLAHSLKPVKVKIAHVQLTWNIKKTNTRSFKLCMRMHCYCNFERHNGDRITLGKWQDKGSSLCFRIAVLYWWGLVSDRRVRTQIPTHAVRNKSIVSFPPFAAAWNVGGLVVLNESTVEHRAVIVFLNRDLMRDGDPHTAEHTCWLLSADTARGGGQGGP